MPIVSLLTTVRSRLLSSTAIDALSVYAVNGFDPAYVTDFGAEFYRKSGATSTFSDSITHSAASNATMVDSDGLLKWRPHNLLLYSEDFTNAAWLKVNATLSGGLLTATANGGKIQQNLTVPAYSKVILYVVKGSASTVTVDNGVAGFNDQTVFDLDALSYTLRLNNTAASITDIGGGIIRLTVTRGATAGSRISLAVDVSGETITLSPNWHLHRNDLGGMVNNPDRGDSYVPTTTSAVYLPRRGHHVYNGDSWVNKGLLHESEQRVNLLTYSNDLTNAFWTQTSADRVQIDTLSLAPSGETTAQIVEVGSVSTASDRGYYAGFSASLVPYTYSVFVSDAGGGTGWVSLGSFDTTGGIIKKTFFNLASGSVGTIHADHTAKIEQFGNYYRISITFTPDGTGVPRVYFILAEADNDTSIDIATYPQGTQWVKHYGAQLEAASTPSSYIPTSGATVTRSAETLTVPAANLPWPSPTYAVEFEVSSWTGVAWDTFTTDGTTFSGDKSTSGGTDTAYSDVVVACSLGEEVYIEVDFLPGTNTQARINLSSTTNGRSTYVEVDPSAGGTFGVYVTPNVFSGTFSVSVSTTLLGTINVTGARAKTVRRALSIQMQGEATGDSYTPLRWYKDANNYITQNIGTSDFTFTQANAGVVDSVTGGSFTSGVNSAFNFASTHASTFVAAAVNGTSLTANTTPTALTDLSATDAQIGYDFNGTIQLVRVWADDITATGREEASTNA